LIALIVSSFAALICALTVPAVSTSPLTMSARDCTVEDKA
jgi:hypothetical protein